jgi:hypothetical protein
LDVLLVSHGIPCVPKIQFRNRGSERTSPAAQNTPFSYSS